MVNEAILAYDGGKLPLANKLYKEAEPIADPGDLRVLNGLYITSWQLGQRDAARDAFGKLVESGLEQKRLPVKLLFQPGKTQFNAIGDLPQQYDMWIASLAQKAGKRQFMCARRGTHQPYRQRARQRDPVAPARGGGAAHAGARQPQPRHEAERGRRRVRARRWSGWAPTTCAMRSIGAWSSGSWIACDRRSVRFSDLRAEGEQSNVKRAYAIGALSSLLLAMVPVLEASAASDRTAYDKNCAGCHSSPVANPPLLLSQTPTANAQYGKLINNSAIYGTRTQLQNSIPVGSTMPKSILDAGSLVDTTGTVTVTAGDADAVWVLIRKYLIDVRDGVVTTSGGTEPTSATSTRTLTFAASVLVGATYPNPATDPTNPALQTITIENPRDLSIKYKVNTLTEFPAAFPTCSAVDGNGYHTVPAGGTCTIRFGFKPANVGTRQGALTIDFQSESAASVNAAPGQRNVTLQGTGFRLGPNQIGPAALTTKIGTPTSTSAALVNAGGTPVTLSSVAFSGPTNGFSLPGGGSDECVGGYTINAGTSCTLHVGFDGSATGTANVLIKTSNPVSDDRTIVLSGIATLFPRIEFDQTFPINFGERVINSAPSDPTTIKVSNSGTAPLVITSVGKTGDVGDFIVSGDCLQAGGITIPAPPSPPVAPLPSCSIVAQFAPVGLNARSMTLTVNSNADNAAVFDIVLNGIGKPVPAAKLFIDPVLPIAFGHQTINNPLYPPRTLHIENKGDLDMTLAITLPSDGFAITNPCPPTLAVAGQPGSSCDLSIRFAPTRVEHYAASITLTTNDPAALTQTVALSGDGDAQAMPIASWSSVSGSVVPVSALDFGTVSVGSSSPPQTVYLHNEGPGGLQLGFVNVIGANGGSYTVTGCAGGQVLFAGGECAIQIVFTPDGGGPRTGSLQVAATGSVPAPLSLTGSGSSEPKPSIALNPASLALGDVRVGSNSAAAEVTLSNPSTLALHVSAFAATTPFVVSSKTCGTMPFTMPPQASCVLTVMFSPIEPGPAKGTLSVASDAEPAELALSGQASEPADVTSGGCSLSSGRQLMDPTLWMLGIAALLVLSLRGPGPGLRRRRRRPESVEGHPHE